MSVMERPKKFYDPITLEEARKQHKDDDDDVVVQQENISDEVAHFIDF